MEDPETPQEVGCCGRCCWRKQNNTTVEENPQTRVPAPQSDSCSLMGNSETSKKKAAFCGDLPQPLLPGHCIEVNGTPLKHCESFAVNFTTGSDEKSDIVFHFNPRLVQNYVARNSKRRGKWENEETTSHQRLHLPRNESFCLSFFIAQKEFMVAINGKHFCVFPFRIPIAKAMLVEVHGEVKVANVEIKEMSSYPGEGMSIGKPVPFKDEFDGVTELPNPFIGHLHKGFKDGWQLEIHGKVKILPHDFYINLQEGMSLWPHPNIPLHLKPKFNATDHANSLVRNAWINGSWCREERTPGFHFSPYKPFRMLIQLDLNRELFIVWVNGQLQGEFVFWNSYSAQNIDAVYIQGDVTIYKVFMQEQCSNVFDGEI